MATTRGLSLLLDRVSGSGSATRAARRFTRRADAARDSKAYREAAELYEKALLLIPDNAGIHVQCGHMFKESGYLTKAEEHYLAAHALIPDDADLALQMGHFYKVAGQIHKGEKFYLRALELAPDWSEPAAELNRLYRWGYRDPASLSSAHRSLDVASSVGQPRGAASANFDETMQALGPLGVLEALAPEVAPRDPRDLYINHNEGVEVRRFGRSERTRWGSLNVLRGIEALRGFCISEVPIVEMTMVMNGGVIYRQGPLFGAYLRYEKERTKLRKYAFNIWYDFSNFAPGRYEIDICFIDDQQGARVKREYVVVAKPLSPELHPESDGIVTIDNTDTRSVDDQINAQPSMIRPARRALFAEPPKNVLVMRLDQLGDMVCSVPALRRLREILPDSNLVGLIAPANKELEASLKLFDEVILVDFPDDPLERQRIMPLSQQLELRNKLKPYKFDLAIDMSDVSISRPLLKLSDAPFAYGFRPGESQWLSAGFEGVTRDFANGLECTPHTAKMMGFVEWLGVLMKSHSKVVPRTDLPRSILAKYGLAEKDFVVFHTGARIVFSRWPHYAELSAMVLQRTGLNVVMMTDDPSMRDRLPSELTASDRFQLLDKRLSFDEFDALVTYSSAFVGNDSGPKHLASFRGANVVSIHMARNNWNEWGQENSGYIASRKVPCAGCSIHHDPEECGKDFACIKYISAEEVYSAISEFI